MITSPNTRHRILEAASTIFYKNGYRATGVETIAASVGITKPSLYHHFQSKDVLIEETLRFMSAHHLNAYANAWNKAGLQPIDRLTVLFDEMDIFFKSPDCYGCPFINAAAEFSDRDSPVRKICAGHYEFVLDNLEQFARESNLNAPRELAEKIVEIMMGAYASWVTFGFQNAAVEGKKMAETFIEMHAK